MITNSVKLPRLMCPPYIEIYYLDDDIALLLTVDGWVKFNWLTGKTIDSTYPEDNPNVQAIY